MRMPLDDLLFDAGLGPENIGEGHLFVADACSDPSVLRTLALHSQAYTLGHDAIAGTALGGVPLAVALGIEVGYTTLIVRDEAKGHGTGSRIEGSTDRVDSALVVEDVTTTGTSLLDAVEALRDAGIEVHHAVTVVDREQGARDLLDDNDVALHALTTLSELTDATGVEP